MHNNTRTQEIQVLRDLNKKGKPRPWAENKAVNEVLSSHYLEINLSKAARLKECATYLLFQYLEDAKKLKQANFCRVRLCPMCNWRRSLKVSGQLHKIVQAIKGEGQYSYLLLTLTVKNVEGDKLSSTIDDMMRGFHKFIKYKPVKDTVEGWFRSMEVTHNLEKDDISFDTYHPHFHLLLCVKPSYFKPGKYLNHADWRGLWKKAMGLDYDPVVNIKRTYGQTPEAVAEAAKYAVKPGDYIIPEDYDLSIETIRTLDFALNKRRFVGMGGIFKKMHKTLNLDDPEDGDLIQADEDQPEGEGQEILFVWHVGYSDYVKG